MLTQRLAGLAAILAGLAVLVLDADITILSISAPVGFYLLFTDRQVMD